LEQCPTGSVTSRILERCRKNATDPDVVRILNGDQEFIDKVRSRASVALDDDNSLLFGEEEI
jgi:hypothetical protein